MKIFLNIVEELKTHILYSITSFQKSSWIARAAHTHRISSTDFPLQQWLHESTTVLNYTVISCLVDIDRLPSHEL